MNSNFDFLKKLEKLEEINSEISFIIRELHLRAKSAEERVLCDIRGSLAFTRMALELTINAIYRLEDKLKRSRHTSTLSTMMSNGIFRKKINQPLLSKLYQIKDAGNEAIHSDEKSISSDIEAIKTLHEFIKQFHNEYIAHLGFYNKPFNEDILKEYSRVKELTKEELHDLEVKFQEEKDKLNNLLEKKEKQIAQLIHANESHEKELYDLRRYKEDTELIVQEFKKLQFQNSGNETYFTFKICDFGITEERENVWGRVFVNYVYMNKQYYAIKYFTTEENAIQEKFYFASGTYQECSMFQAYDKKHTNLDPESVLSTKYDNYKLVSEVDKFKFGTPSILAEKLLVDIKRKISFQKGDKEYVDNGHYIIDKEEYMSIWTFKKVFLKKTDSPKQNGLEAISLLKKGVLYFNTKPDFGPFREIKIYPINILKEYYQKNNFMKARFFYADETHRTWPKLFVLTENGRFYCEYLDYMNPAKVDLKFDYANFKAEDYLWSGYQSIVEIDEQKAISIPLTRQANWVKGYLSTL
ncbi:hypothetical protein [Saccharicrinis aurantiacus]|uniref:hypothetical protein n=1 Tax=Saccharicrinis aurantiacus TaxID=1849719 RepID=UPI0024902809|nr:hypothetical protein [Saccharicrinis aurantiacus]